MEFPFLLRNIKPQARCLRYIITLSGKGNFKKQTALHSAKSHLLTSELGNPPRYAPLSVSPLFQ
jgi:hypothetical protein